MNDRIEFHGLSKQKQAELKTAELLGIPLEWAWFDPEEDIPWQDKLTKEWYLGAYYRVKQNG